MKCCVASSIKPRATIFNWRRLNRRALAQDVYLPGLHSEHCGKIQSWIDTSGSIDQHTLNAFWL